MDYKIITDTSCDLGRDYRDKLNLDFVPFYISIEGKEYIDSDDLNIGEFLDAMVGSKNPIKTACPSPNDFLKALRASVEDNIFVVTISSKLSGSFNSAKIAVDEFRNENPEKNIYLLDSKTATAGQTALILKLRDIIAEESSFEDKVNQAEKAVKETSTYFILERFDNLVKNGRMPKVGNSVVNLFNIRPIMKVENGEIALHEINRGFKKALDKLAGLVGKEIKTFADKTLVISHVDAKEVADILHDKIKDLYDFKEIIVLQTRALASGYADKGGVIIGF